MSAVLSESYIPQWLYVREFMDALGSADEYERRDAVVLLIRDRLVFDGKIDEKHFRFLAGKPSIVDASWLANLSESEINWEDSTIRAPREPDGFSMPDWFLIEIATSALSLFRSRTLESAPQARRTPQWKTPAPGMIRAKIHEVYSEEKAAGRRVPNINQTPKIVRKKLNADGYDASDLRIKEIADEPEFKALREPVGVRAT
jgi:hypothetical protein